MTDTFVIRVNADEPEYVKHAFELAVEYRQTFHRDVYIEILGYRPALGPNMQSCILGILGENMQLQYRVLYWKNICSYFQFRPKFKYLPIWTFKLQKCQIISNSCLVAQF